MAHLPEGQHLLKAINVAGLVGSDMGNLLGIHIKYATVCGLLSKEIHNIRPKLVASVGSRSEEGNHAIGQVCNSSE